MSKSKNLEVIPHPDHYGTDIQTEIQTLVIALESTIDVEYQETKSERLASAKELAFRLKYHLKQLMATITEKS